MTLARLKKCQVYKDKSRLGDFGWGTRACTHRSAFCKRGSVNVRFAPKATEVLRRREYGDVPKPDSCAAANSTTRPRLRFRGHDRASISGLRCGAFREQAYRAPFLQIR